MKEQRPTYVYSIKINGTRRYVGITEDFRRRQSEHKRGLMKGTGKQLYVKASELDNPMIEIELVGEFKTTADAARYECWLILGDYFGEAELWQSFPKTIKYY